MWNSFENLGLLIIGDSLWTIHTCHLRLRQRHRKVKHCVNGNVNTNAQNGSEPIIDVLHVHNVKR